MMSSLVGGGGKGSNGGGGGAGAGGYRTGTISLPEGPLTVPVTVGDGTRVRRKWK